MNQPNNIISDELRDLSPVLAAIPRVNVFTIPENYFENLPALILLQTARQSGFGEQANVPGGYFEGLAASIMSRIKEESETADSTVLSGVGNKNVFSVPERYFDNFSTVVMNRIAVDNNSDVFAETNGISATVAAIGNKNIYSIPDNYFNDFAAGIQGKLAGPAKIVQMNSTRKFFKYAAAAVVTGLIAISAFFILNKDESGNAGVATASNAAIMDTAQSIIKTNSFDKEMASLSDADIVNFLESKGQDVDAALVASLSEDEKSLPEADDYLLNENALDDILKDLDLNN